MAGALRVGVMGAGAVGCFIGGRLLARGGDVVLVGRGRARAELRAAGLLLEDLGGGSARVAPEALRFETEAAALGDRDVVLCCTKSAQTEAAAAALAEALRPGTLVVSLQNGVRNADVLRAGLSDQPVLGGIVGFNVVGKGAGTFRQATTGLLVIEDAADPRAAALAEALASAGFQVERARDIRAQQFTKLLMNLNNALSALLDAPTRDLIFDPRHRRIVAALLTESLGVLRAAKIRPARLGAIPVQVFPLVLRLPTPLVRLAVRAQLRIDPEARSSMWQDLSQGRRTEVDHLNGEIVRLAAACGARAPLNARIVALVHEAEARGAGSPRLPAEALWQALSAAAR